MTATPQRYGSHAALVDGATCIACSTSDARLFVDHCHAHGWVRGPLCGRCNTAMAYVDRRMTPKAALADGDITLADLIGHACRCHECPPLTIADLGPTGTLKPAITPMAEKPTTVRFKPGMNVGIRSVGTKLSISFNAALSVLVSEALEARGINPETGEPLKKASDSE